jgi:hypothetical protein
MTFDRSSLWVGRQREETSGRAGGVVPTHVGWKKRGDETSKMACRSAPLSCVNKHDAAWQDEQPQVFISSSAAPNKGRIPSPASWIHPHNPIQKTARAGASCHQSISKPTLYGQAAWTAG